tara:strand:+ start:2196 stop:2429 length:234 start_codon:yes stop_codon:yes gene_type:complete
VLILERTRSCSDEILAVAEKVGKQVLYSGSKATHVMRLETSGLTFFLEILSHSPMTLVVMDDSCLQKKKGMKKDFHH